MFKAILAVFYPEDSGGNSRFGIHSAILTMRKLLPFSKHTDKKEDIELQKLGPSVAQRLKFLTSSTPTSREVSECMDALWASFTSMHDSDQNDTARTERAQANEIEMVNAPGLSS